MGIGICNKSKSQGHKEVKVIGNTNSTVARPLSPDEVVGIFSGGFSWVDVCDVAGMSSAEIVEAVSESMQPKAPSRILSRDDVLELVRAILIFPSPSQHKWAAFPSK